MTTEKEFKAIQLGEITIVEKLTEKDIIEKPEILQFKFHTPNFFKELVECGLDIRMGIYKVPLNEFMRRLAELADIGRKIDNPLLHLWLFDMTLYEESDPESKDYNPKLRKELLKSLGEKDGK